MWIASRIKVVFLALAVAALAACTTPVDDEAGAAPVGSAGGESGSATTSGATDGSIGEGVAVAPVDTRDSLSSGSSAQSALTVPATRTFYFEFDKATVKAAAYDDLAKHAKYLLANPNATVVLEGHADERGTREYNLALGERRGKAIQRVLLLEGVSTAQLSVVSYGEERPVAKAKTDEAYGLNRRVELIYR